MRRRKFIAGAALTGATLTTTLFSGGASAQVPPGGGAHPLWPLWLAWRDRHLDFSGRVVDEPQQRASHSEGQGYGMLLAAEMGDGDAFRRMADWTNTNLAVRPDALLAWRWLPDTPVRVPDLNNASDGDLFHAWALLRGAARFDTPAWAEQAGRIAADLVRSCIAARPDRPGTPILLPAQYGFTTNRGVIINPSYIMPLALRDLAEATGEAQLARVAQSGVSLMQQLSALGPVPDWLELTAAGPRPAPGFSANAGYEAMRVPLYLIWSGEPGHTAVRRSAAAMAQASTGRAATVIDAASGGIIETSTDPGYRAVSALTICGAQGGMGAPIPPFTPNQPYYPATLHLFALLAQMRVLPSCRPL